MCNGVKMFCFFFWSVFREFKQQHRRRLWKHHLKSEFGLPQTLLRLFHLVQFVECWQIFLELNSKGLYESSGKEKKSCCVVFPSSTKREIRKVHVIVVQQWLRNVEKSMIHMQSCCFSNLCTLLFCRRHSHCLSSLLIDKSGQNDWKQKFHLDKWSSWPDIVHLLPAILSPESHRSSPCLFI